MSDHDPLDEKNSKKDHSDDELQMMSLANLMNCAPGRAFMWSYLTQCGIFSTTFSAEPTAMAYRSGMRDAARTLDAELKRASMRFYMLMIEENDNGG